MPKRKIDAVDGHELSVKRRRVGAFVRLENVSDELVLRILSFLSPYELGLVARVSRRLHLLANDNESWKERYYSRWIRTRVLQIPSATPRAARDIPRYSAKSANWLDHRHLVFPLKTTNWKWQYRIRNNWHRGTCNMHALEVLQPPAAPVVIKVHGGVIFQATPTCVQAWSNKKGQELLASQQFDTEEEQKSIPTTMAIDASNLVLRVGIGFSDSTFRCYEYHQTSGFGEYCIPQYFLDNTESVSVLAMNFPIVFALVGKKNFLLKRLENRETGKPLDVWEELAWLQAGRKYECLPSLSLRRVGTELAASIAYTSELIGGSNWCLGLQELRLSDMTSPIVRVCENGSTGSEGEPQLQLRSLDAWTPAFPTHSDIDSRPKALSYSHPYLLAALPDNTMMVYLVTSTADNLNLSDGCRLWGHTSGISGAEVNMRGKAVTSSNKGGEIRVWDLEGLARGFSQGRTSIPLVPTPIVDSSTPSRTDFLPHSTPNLDQLTFTKTWIAFDDEQVLVMGERRDHRILARYDFTK